MAQASQAFALSLDKDFAETEAEAKLFVRATALEALKRVVEKTPVATGRARGNWGVTIGAAPEEGATENTDKQGTSTVLKGAGVLGGYDTTQGYPVIGIYNNLPYIERLENGYSKIKAPLGMVALTVAELQGGSS